MKTTITKLNITVFFIAMIIVPVLGQTVSENEAKTIAQNWINIITDNYGGWGHSQNATPKIIHKIERNDRLIGYYCQVNPQGFIVMSVRKNLTPVKAYNEYGSIDMDIDDGFPDLVKDRMERILDMMDQKEKNNKPVGTYSGSWYRVYTYQIGSIKKDIIESNGKNYIIGETLLTSSWHQHPPYNNQCPDSSCSETTNGRCVVGCVATAGSQILRYWNWPPVTSDLSQNHSFNWEFMKNNVTTSSSQGEQDAVAELCHIVGITVDMDYGCTGSSSYTSKIKDAFKDHYYYSGDCSVENRFWYSTSDWFDKMRDEFDLNRPIQYKVDSHSIVADGWRIDSESFQVHMNYGWGGPYNAWYLLDSLYLGIPDEEYMVIKIKPINTLGSSLWGYYIKPLFFPYARYFDLDATGDATFAAGQKLQFLRKIKVESTGTINFEGSSSDYLKLYAIQSANGIIKGIKIGDGKVVLHNEGAIKFH